MGPPSDPASPHSGAGMQGSSHATRPRRASGRLPMAPSVGGRTAARGAGACTHLGASKVSNGHGIQAGRLRGVASKAARVADAGRGRRRPAAHKDVLEAGRGPDPPPPLQQWHSVIDELEAFAEKSRRRRPRLRAHWPEVALPLTLQAPPRIAPAFAAYCAALPNPQAHQVATIEDKDTSSGWLMDREAYQWRGSSASGKGAHGCAPHFPRPRRRGGSPCHSATRRLGAWPRAARCSGE